MSSTDLTAPRRAVRPKFVEFAGATEANDRRRALRKMRALATGLLVVMVAIFVVTSLVRRDWPWLAYLRAFAEAGMIGACADWFAVVALFRHPLGVPIPHTAIVPRSKERIGAAIGRFMANNFLSPRVLAERIRDVDFSGWAVRWLLRSDNARTSAQRAAALLQQVLHSLPRDDLNAFLSSTVRRGAEGLPAAPLASKILSLIWAQGEMQLLIEHAIAHLGAALARNREAIKSKVSQRSSRLIPKWIDGILADKIVTGMTRILDEMREPAHPWRIELAQAVERAIDSLATDPDLIARGEELKTRLLDNPTVNRHIDMLWVAIEMRLDSPATTAQLAGAFEGLLIGIGTRIKNDERMRTGINRCVRIAVLRTVAPRRAEIADFIRRVVENWDTETLIERIELQVGRDLQYIRINGTLVGGLVGLAIFTLARSLQ